MKLLLCVSPWETRGTSESGSEGEEIAGWAPTIAPPAPHEAFVCACRLGEDRVGGLGPRGGWLKDSSPHEPRQRRERELHAKLLNDLATAVGRTQTRQHVLPVGRHTRLNSHWPGRVLCRMSLHC